MMYKNWLKIKKQEEKERLELKKKIDEELSKFTAKDWKEFREAEFEVKVIPDKEAEQRVIEEEEKVDAIIDGTFWKLDNPDFEELTDEMIGKKGREILGYLKPFYRKELVKTYEVENTLIFITAELEPHLKTDDRKYKIEPEQWCNKKTGAVINCDSQNIWYNEKWERSKANIEKARERGLLKNYVPSIASYHSESYVSLRELYDEKIELGLDHHKLRKMAYSNDLLDKLFFLYTIKRAQKQDEIAADLLYKMYENVAAFKASKWIRSIELKDGIKFKKGSELDILEIQIVAKYFLRLLITGDDPSALFEHIKSLDNPRNIESLFTRYLGKKIKDLVKYMTGYLKKEVEELKKFEKQKPLIGMAMDKEFAQFETEKVKGFMGKIDAARAISRNPKKKTRTTYREFIKLDKLNERLIGLYTIYYEAEDELIENKIKGLPLLNDLKFDEYSDKEKEEFEKIRKLASNKADANEYDNWNTYQSFIDEDELDDVEKRMYEIYKNYDLIMNTEYYASIEVKRLSISALSNPLSWFLAAPWFNDKIFNAKKNNNFTKWLLGGEGSNGGKPTRGALIDLMNNWLRSSNFMKDTRRRIFKDELLEMPYVKKYEKIKKAVTEDSDDENYEEQESVLSFDENSEKGDDLIEEKLMKYKKETNVMDKHIEIIRVCLEKNIRRKDIKYEQIADEFKLTIRHIIRIWKKFESWLMPK